MSGKCVDAVMRLPCKAKIIAFEGADGVGTLELDEGERVRFGASACLGFIPEVGISCWLIETKPNAIGPGVRAKTINLSGVVEPDRLTQINEANRRAEETQRAEEQRRHARHARPYEAIRERARFEVPALYRRMEGDSVLRYGESRDQWRETCEMRALSNPPALLCVYDFQWLTLEDMATWEPPDYWKQEHVFVPFARTARRDLWCWYPPWTTDSKTPVVLAHNDRNEAESRASDFEALLVREMLETFAGVYHDDDLCLPVKRLQEHAADRLRKILRANVETLRPYIRGEWTSLLSGLLDRPFIEIADQNATSMALLDEWELQEILHREMPFPRAGEVFPHMQPYPPGAPRTPALGTT
jgi:hypothetical protein